jgi:hypothetical protein
LAARIAYWDIETSDLKADVGRLLCAVIYDPISRKYEVFRNDELSSSMASDEDLALKLRDSLEQYPITSGWHSKGFDIPFLNTRLAKYGHRPLRRHLHLDGRWYMAGWRGLSPRSAKLGVAAEFFNLPNRKPSVDVDVWINAAMGGDTKAMDELVERCKADTKITAQVTERLLDLGVVRNIQSYP